MCFERIGTFFDVCCVTVTVFDSVRSALFFAQSSVKSDALSSAEQTR
jgi:hypothetical protein